MTLQAPLLLRLREGTLTPPDCPFSRRKPSLSTHSASLSTALSPRVSHQAGGHLHQEPSHLHAQLQSRCRLEYGEMQLPSERPRRHPSSSVRLCSCGLGEHQLIHRLHRARLLLNLWSIPRYGPSTQSVQVTQTVKSPAMVWFVPIPEVPQSGLAIAVTGTVSSQGGVPLTHSPDTVYEHPFSSSGSHSWSCHSHDPGEISNDPATKETLELMGIAIKLEPVEKQRPQSSPIAGLGPDAAALAAARPASDPTAKRSPSRADMRFFMGVSWINGFRSHGPSQGLLGPADRRVWSYRSREWNGRGHEASTTLHDSL